MRFSEILESSEQLRAIARDYVNAIYGPGDAGYIDPDEANWRKIDDYPLARFLHLMTAAEWVKWYKVEHREAVLMRNGRHESYDDMVASDIREEIIVYDDGRVGWLWDGWHRVAASFKKGARSVPAIVGTALKAGQR
jgi:hypothetical protein